MYGSISITGQREFKKTGMQKHARGLYDTAILAYFFCCKALFLILREHKYKRFGPNRDKVSGQFNTGLLKTKKNKNF
jgi:hypothetical protein